MGGNNDDNTGDLDPTRNQQTPADSETDNRLGFVRYTKEKVDQDQDINRTTTIDRNHMADMITRIILRHGGFNEVATLVTGKEVLIAYEKRDDMDAKTAADVAKRTAMSILPRFFDVYVSDNPSLIGSIHSLHNETTTTNNYQNTIDQIIQEMKKSPQGYDDFTTPDKNRTDE